MPWKTTDAISQRAEFVALAAAGDQSISALCRRFGVSRKTGYKWLSRSGSRPSSQVCSLADRSRRPHTIHRISPEVRQQAIQLRLSHASAGEIASLLCSQGVQICKKTVQRIMCEEGLVRRANTADVPWIGRLYASRQPQEIIVKDVPNAKCPDDFAAKIQSGSRRDRVKGIAVLAGLKRIPIRLIADALNISAPTVIRYMHLYEVGGVDRLFEHPKSKIHDEEHREAVLGILHSPPSSHGINRTTWIMDDLHRVLRESGHHLSESRIRRIIKSGGFKWRRAKVVLTSNDPEYEKKLGAVKEIVSGLKEDEAFCSIDEYDPFAVKKKPGRKRVAPEEQYTVPQWQKSKGWLILTAALELLRNQVTHFYSRAKNTDEMIRMADLLRHEYRWCSRIFLSWDAASWHMSKKLMEFLDACNAEAASQEFPILATAPLPAGAQFLNVIESVFSGMSRAVIHNSDYPSVSAAKRAIDQHFACRNAFFLEHKKRAGGKIWSQERVPSEFHEGQNCKDPRYR